jgi:lysophospholipase L1-like esterase
MIDASQNNRNSSGYGPKRRTSAWCCGVVAFSLLLILFNRPAFSQVKEKDKPRKPVETIKRNGTSPPKPLVPLRSLRGIENAAALEKFFKALSSLKRKIEPVRILHFGDSHIARGALTAEIAKNFKRDFNDGGVGYVVPLNVSNLFRPDLSMGTSSGWEVVGIGGRLEPDQIYGLAGMSLSTTMAGESAWVETECNHFEIYFLRQPLGGAIDIILDGQSVLKQPISLANDAPLADYYTFDTPADRLHRVEVRTIVPGRTRILGIVTEQIGPGVSYDVLGLNGARAKRLIEWNDTAFVDNLVQRKPDLIIVSYGTYDVADDDWTIESYQRMFAAILQRFRRAAPQASILVIGPPDRADATHVGSKIPEMIEAQRRASFQAGAAFWSSYGAMGGAGSMDVWASKGLGQADRIHFTNVGYQTLGLMSYEDIMDAYKAYLTRLR